MIFLRPNGMGMCVGGKWVPQTRNLDHHESALYPLVNNQFDPENHQFLMVSLVFQPPSARVHVNLPEGN